VLSNAQVRLIFWGVGWDNPSQAVVRTELVSRINELNSSTYFYSPLPGADLSQYSVGSAARPTVVDNLRTNYLSPGVTFTTQNVIDMLNHEYGMDTARYYFVIPDANSTPTGCGCSALHTFWTQSSNHERFGYEQNRATPSIDELTLLYSHEMVESITDPEGTALQVNPRNPTNWNEISDGEAQNYAYRVNNHVWAQSYYSDADHRFTVPTGSIQHFFVSASHVLTVNGGQGGVVNNSITIDVSGGGVRATLNGAVAQFDPGQISSIVVNSGHGNNVTNILRTIVPVSVVGGGTLDTVNIGTGGSVQGISATVNVTNPPVGGYTTLNIDDSADAANHFNVVVTAGSVTGLAPATISYAQGDLRNLNISTGTGSNTVNVQSTPFNGVQNPHTALIGHSGSTTVNIGNAGTLTGIQGAVDVSNPPVGGYTTLNIDDSADGGTHSNVVVTSGSVTNLAATISYQQSDLAGLNINTGTGTNGISVQSTPFNSVQNPQTALNVQSAATTVTLGSPANTLDGISNVAVNDSTGSVPVRLNDGGFGGADDYTIFASNVSIARSSTFLLTYSGIGSLSITAGSGGEIFDIDTTSVPTTVNGGAGFNCFHVSPFTQYLAASILGPLTLNGNAADVLDFFDVNDLGNETFIFDTVPTTLALGSLGGAVIATFNMAGSNIYVMTNGISTPQDASGMVNFDPIGGPPCSPSGDGITPIATRTVHRASPSAFDATKLESMQPPVQSESASTHVQVPSQPLDRLAVDEVFSV
jgi:hypothetical protein